MKEKTFFGFCKKIINDIPEVEKTLELFIDLSDLQDEVIEYWQDNAINYSMVEDVGAIGVEHLDMVIKPAFQAELDDPMCCVNQLGFDDISDYLASKQDEQEIVESKARMIFSGKLNKNYFRKQI